jgi:phage tail-like protein
VSQFFDIGVGDAWEAPLTSTFVVDVDGKTIGHFTEVQGLELEIEVEEIEEGGVNSFVHKVPGRMKWPNITLKRGVTDSDALFTWMQDSSGDGFTKKGNKVTRSTMGITLMAPDGTALREWSVEGAFPIKWSGPSFAASSDDVLNEELEIAHHGFRAESF